MSCYWSSSPGSCCWHPSSFSKAIVILVDALRYDFTVPFTPKDGETAHHYHNALPFLYATAVKQPNNAFLLPFIADPPTVTLQRLKGLTTGTLPTFVDAGSNFAGTAIDEDNLIAQLRTAGKNVVHLGDDTWHALFPDYFDPDLTRPFDSFNVWDLHTVDNGVNEHLFPLLHPTNISKWDVVIGHYLGVDHAGHRYGPDHPAMTAKLQQMNGVFHDLVNAVDNETLVVVMGDHGMDSKGDHGGESDDEIEAAIWMYSKKGIFGRTSVSSLTPPATAKERPVAQIDLVPTLSLLLGLPIPFNNLGRPIDEAFIGAKGSDIGNLALANRVTSAQIHRYQYEYAQARGLSDESRSTSLDAWTKLTEIWDLNQRVILPGGQDWKGIYTAAVEYQTATLEICRALWARFDVVSMLHGVEVLALGLVALVVYARGINGDRTELTPLLLIRATIGTVAGIVVGLTLGLSIPQFQLIHATVYCTAIGGLLGLATGFYHIRNRLQSPIPSSAWSWTSLMLPVALSAGFAANSFTIWEDEILLFFLNTFGVLLFLSSFRQKSPVDRTIGCTQSIAFTVLTRLASLSRLCREEQMPHCRSTYYASANSSTSATWQLTIPFILTLALPAVIKTYFAQTLSYQHSATFMVGFILRLGLALTALFWTLDAADDGEWFGGSTQAYLKTVKVFVAQVVLAIGLAAGYATFGWAAPLLNIREERNSSATELRSASQPIETGEGEAKSSIIILGYANVHGSRYLLLFIPWLVAVILLQKPMGGGAIGILAWQVLSLLEIIDANQLADTPVGPVVLGLLGSFHFFKTGHQATLSSVQWESAFIPLHYIRYPWSPLFVMLNTFGAQILCAIAVPATVLWKAPPKKKGLLGDVAKAMATHILFYALINLATTMWAGHLRRHLMLYRIFSPRFMVGAIVLLIVDLVGILVAVGGTRWSFMSVADVFGWSSVQ
ncbi:alkaline phosphatase-like protein [Pseudovirgaria hyperparasitica]|uniref:Alkaline phosphatase-like protein n=1 Tax=Pseudovirgaria hyperparasitica TaxID=470096 RepID=A0A6A6VYG9_9PEZI|nr:alkaline phosphatase-like protein [Pseudovirgaria hyperparasitica]KAF2755698.1 alkaline phosphatase-like protein [Pseudovirgaria hyperparasitica]